MLWHYDNVSTVKGQFLCLGQNSAESTTILDILCHSHQGLNRSYDFKMPLEGVSPPFNVDEANLIDVPHVPQVCAASTGKPPVPACNGEHSLAMCDEHQDTARCDS